ncbi:MAG: bifunctional folylpolyglutamate synthase/dihydrofolate synthase [Thermoplasmataceae archaeon]
MDKEILDYLYSLKREGVKMDLSVVRSLSETTGISSDLFKSMHVAGTNGKGSTACLLYNVKNAREKTGLYTSPHLVYFNERIISGREMIPDSYIEGFIRKHMDEIESQKKFNRNPTFFEVTTIMAFGYFIDTGCSSVSVEVGLGGRLDATNIITPEISVITHIGFDHANILGGSLTSIAREKAGIIKEGVPVVTGENKPEALREIIRVAGIRQSRVIRANEYCRIVDLEASLEGNKFRAVTEKDSYEISSSMPGKYQVKNIATAISALENLPDPPSRADIEAGISTARWPGRLEVVRTEPTVIIDAAHNPPAASTLVSALKELVKEEPVLLVGQLKDKDYYSFLSALRPLSGRIILTTPDEESRAEDPEKLMPIALRIYREVNVIKDPVEAYAFALNQSAPVIVTGSIYLIGIIKKLENSSLYPFK